MHRRIAVAAAAGLFSCATAYAAQVPTGLQGPVNLDLSYPADEPASAQTGVDPALSARQKLVDSHRLRRGSNGSSFDRRLKTPSFLWAREGLVATAPMMLDRPSMIEAAGRDALAKEAFALGIDATTISQARLTQIHDTGRGPLIASFVQTVAGDEVFGRRLAVAMDARFNVVATSGYFLPMSQAARDQAASDPYSVTPQQAVSTAFADLGGTIASSQLTEVGSSGSYRYFAPAASNADYHLVGNVRAKPVRFVIDDQVQTAYYLELSAATVDGYRDDQYAYVVSAVDGRVLFRRNMEQHESFGYQAMADSANINQPFDHPLGNQYLPVPSLDPKATYVRVPATSNLVTLQSSPLIASGDPWLAAGATVTSGNNVNAYLDLSSPDGFQPARGDLQPTVTGTRVFDYPVAVDTDPTTPAARAAAAVNLFYLNNWLHDAWYASGFDEASGNAQSQNYGRGGIGGDPILAQGQDYSGTNNANMSTPADGSSPRMQMYLFDGIFSGALTIVSPAIGDLAAAPATFGPKSFDLTQDVVAYLDDTAPTTDACTAATNAVALSGKIALIDRGNCDFTVKVGNAQAAGAAGVIMVNNVPGEAPFTFGAADTTITIPSLMTTFDDGLRVRDALASGPVTARLLRNASTPLDGTLDNGIIAHEFFHYVSNRLVNDGSGLSNTQGGSMGEGWSDVAALLLSVREEDRAVIGNDRYQGAYSLGYYVLNDAYFGIRRAPYSTQFAVNPLTFKYIENGVPLPTTAPLAFGSDGASNAEVHNAGEIWVAALWDAYASLLNDSRYTFAQARTRMQDYLIAGLKLTPTSPTFTEARDAILAAAIATDAQDFDLFNAAFARRGMGLYAVSAPRNSRSNAGVIESFVSQSAPPLTATARFDLSIQDANGSYCDTDSVLDAGESALLTVSMPIGTSGGLVDGTVATVSELGSGHLSFVDGNALSLLPDNAGNVVGSLRVKLGSGSAAPYSFPIEVALPELGPTVVAQFPSSTPAGDTLAPYYTATVNYDLVSFNRASDDIEQIQASANDWVISQTGVTPTIRIADFNSSFGTGSLWWAPSSDLQSESLLTSPPISVTALGNFSLSFDHYYAFSDSNGSVPPTGADGGVIEISVDGRPWVDVTTLATFTAGGYNGTLSTGSTSRAGYVGSNRQMTRATLDFGTSVAGSSIRLRFHQFSNAGVGNIGWLVDNVGVNSIAVPPFSSVATEDGVCVARPPYADAGADFSAPSFYADGSGPVVVTLQGKASDADGTSSLRYQWTQVSGIAVTLNNPTTLTPSFNAPVVTSNRQLVFQLTVSDGSSQSRDSVTVTITPSNQAPIANAGPDSSGFTGAPIALSGAGSSDPDGSISLYQWTQTAGPTVVLSGATSAAPQFTPSQAGVYGFTLTVTDNGGLTATDSVQVIVQAKPVANAGADATVLTGATVTLDGSGSSDADGSITRYAWTQAAGPSVAITNAGSAKATFKPTAAGTYGFTLTVTDNDGNSASDTLTITVVAAPVANAGSDATVAAGSLVTLDGSGSSDPDGSISQYQWTQSAGPTAVLSGANNVRAQFTPNQAGVYAFTLTVTDNDGYSSQDSVTVTVQAPPVANAGSNQSVYLGAQVLLDGSASRDPDGTIQRYSWAQIAGTAVTLSNAATATPSFTASLPGSFGFALTVTDNDGRTANSSVTVSVLTLPMADAGADQSLRAPTPVTLDGSRSSDADGDLLRYLWSQTAGTAVTLRDAATPRAQFDAVSGGEYQFALTVTDASGNVARDTVTISVLAPLVAPTAAAGSDARLVIGQTLTLDASTSIGGSSAISGYQWTQTAGPTASLSATDTAQISMTSDKPGIVSMLLTVTNAEGLSASDTVVVTVIAPPVVDTPDTLPATAGNSVALVGTASDVDGSIAGYSWRQVSGPTVALRDADTASASFTPSSAGTYVFELTVTDSDGLSTTTSTTVLVRPEPSNQDDGNSGSGGGGAFGSGSLLVLIGALALRRRYPARSATGR